jgi:cytochrome-b5 reductase
MVSQSELALHNKKDDLWIALNGNVYDVTLYLQYHPGGETMLMKGAGKESIEIFNYHHNWVNYNNLIGKLQVGYLSDLK